MVFSFFNCKDFLKFFYFKILIKSINRDNIYYIFYRLLEVSRNSVLDGIG